MLRAKHVQAICEASASAGTDAPPQGPSVSSCRAATALQRACPGCHSCVLTKLQSDAAEHHAPCKHILLTAAIKQSIEVASLETASHKPQATSGLIAFALETSEQHSLPRSRQLPTPLLPRHRFSGPLPAASCSVARLQLPVRSPLLP